MCTGSYVANRQVPGLCLLCDQKHSVDIFSVHGSMHRESMSIVLQDATMYSLLYFCKLLYMFRVVTPPIIRSTYNCNYSIWHWSDFGKCSVWSQLKMRGMDPSLLPSAIALFVVGPAGPTTTNSTATTTLKPEAATAVVELLMMGMRTPETCWAVHKLQVINGRNCCIWLVDIFELSFCIFLHPPITIPWLSTLSPNNLSLCFSLNITNYASHPQKRPKL